MAITAQISASFVANDNRTRGLSNAGANIAPTITLAYTDGSAAGMANVLWHDARTLSGTTDSLDLNGALTDAFGSSVVDARVKALYIKNTSATTSLTVGGGSNAWATCITGTLVLPPGAFVILATPDAAGWAVTALTGDVLTITGTATKTYDIAVLGASA